MPDPKPTGLKGVDRLARWGNAMQKVYKPRDFKGDTAKVKAAAKELAEDAKSEVDAFAKNIGEMADVGSKNLDEGIVQPAKKAVKGFAGRVKKLL